jgi:hypothetical protein
VRWKVRGPEPPLVHHVDEPDPGLDRLLAALAQEVLVGNDVLGDDLGRHQPDLVGLVVERRDG